MKTNVGAGKAVDIIGNLLKTIPNSVNSELGIVIANQLFPRSVGIEFECHMKPDAPIELFQAIPNIMSCDCSVTQLEQRFRMPPGLNGFKCLFDLSQLLCKWGIPTTSGLHYHTDMTDIYSRLSERFINEQEEWILDELECWDDKGDYNSRAVEFYYGGAVWVRFQSGFRTMECRIGEMTFDYELLIKRVLHLQEIAERIKHELQFYNEIGNKKLLEEQLEPELDELDLDEVRRIIANRMIE